MNNQQQLEVLNDLVRINNDRIEGYKKASENLKGADAGLLTLFQDYERQSQENKRELNKEMTQLGGQSDEDTTMSGKIYRAWMDVKATFGGDDAKGILASCEGGEDAAKKAYESAVASGDLSGNALSLVSRQQQMQLAAHDKIKAMRDQYKAPV